MVCRMVFRVGAQILVGFGERRSPVGGLEVDRRHEAVSARSVERFDGFGAGATGGNGHMPV